MPNVSKQNRKHQTSNSNKVQTSNEMTILNASNKKVLCPIIFSDDIHNCMHTCGVFILLILCLQNNCFSFSLTEKIVEWLPISKFKSSQKIVLNSFSIWVLRFVSSQTHNYWLLFRYTAIIICVPCTAGYSSDFGGYFNMSYNRPESARSEALTLPPSYIRKVFYIRMTRNSDFSNAQI